MNEEMNEDFNGRKEGRQTMLLQFSLSFTVRIRIPQMSLVFCSTV